jgi:hypothetical protein
MNPIWGAGLWKTNGIPTCLYGCELWNTLGTTELNNLERARYAAKIIQGLGTNTRTEADVQYLPQEMQDKFCLNVANL